jgi:DNA invertase Pin-like site-specific DNA recombinase
MKSDIVHRRETYTMPHGRFVAYYRVSTAQQGRSGLGLEAQRAAVREWLNGGDWQLVAEYEDVESGKRDDRAGLQAALNACRLRGAKLVIAKLDRLSRDAAFLLTLQNGGVGFIACDMPEANELTVGIMAVVAQAERKMISTRTKAALAAAKARGTVLGGYRGGRKPNPQEGAEARKRHADDFAARLQPIVAPMRDQGMSLRQIAARLAADSIETPNGGAWSADAVRRVLLRT